MTLKATSEQPANPANRDRWPSSPVARRIGVGGWLLAAVTVLTAWRMVALSTNGLGLNFDEAQYWIWAQSPDFGYFSKPPLIAWTIAAAGALCGDGEFCVRLPAPLLHAVATLFVAGAGARLYDARVGLWSGLAYATAPGIGFSSIVMTTDAPVLMFWAIALYAVIRALQDEKPIWWLVAGFASGLGLLSKYAMVYFVLGCAILTIAAPAFRAQLRTGWPWLAGVIALAIFAPNLVWNARHGFVSFGHVGEQAGWTSLSLAPTATLEFLVSQFGLVGPLIFGGFLWFGLRPRYWMGDRRDRMMVAFSAPVLLLVSINGLFGSAQANWAAVAFPSMVIVVSAWWFRFGYRRLPSLSLALGVAILAVIYHYDAIATTVSERAFISFDPFAQFRGRAEVGKRIAEALRDTGATVLLTDTRWEFAEFGYYVRPAPRHQVKWNPSGAVRDHFDLTTSMRSVGDQPVLLVTRYHDARHVRSYFCRSRRVGRIIVRPHRGLELSYSAYLLTGFRGYSRSQRTCP